MTVSDFTQVLSFLSDSFIIGLKFLVPVLFVAKFIALKYLSDKHPIFFKTSGVMMLLAGILFLSTVVIHLLSARFSGNEDDKNLLLSILTGPNWFQIVIPIFCYALLPQLLWFKKLRSSALAQFNIVLIWWLGILLINRFSIYQINLLPDFSNSNDIHKIVIFVSCYFSLPGYFFMQRNLK